VTTFLAVTTFAPQHWHGHAKRCVESFEKYWDGVRLHTFSDRTLVEQSSWLAEFKTRHAHRPTDDYRHDAVRFAHKIAAIDLAMARSTDDALIWIDADCVTHAPVDAAWLSGLLGEADFAYLRRAHKYSETGFMIFRRNECGRLFVNNVVEYYRSDRIFGFPEWHDCWVIDHVRAGMEKVGLLRCVSLSGEFENSGHPLVNGPLGARLDHLKGTRKAAGKSRAKDLIAPRSEPYWR
jgi:hypothetical protein